MRIEQIEIRNYRPFQHAILGGLPSMVVVVGANGSGKSTLYDVLRLEVVLKFSVSPERARKCVGQGGQIRL